MSETALGRKKVIPFLRESVCLSGCKSAQLHFSIDGPWIQIAASLWKDGEKR